MNLRSRAANTRSLGGPVLAAAYRADLRGMHNLPSVGPVVLASSEPGALGRVALASWLPRPVHVIGVPAALGGLPAGGIAAYREGCALLADGAAVAAPGDAVMAAALALRSGATVVPVALAGTSGRVAVDPPRLRSVVTVAMLPGIQALGPVVDPLAWPGVREAAERVRQALADAERQLGMRMGRRQR